MDTIPSTSRDVEANIVDDVDKRATSTFGLAFSEAAGLLALWSLLVINEGAIRFNALTPYGNFSEGAEAAKGVALGVAFFASLFEVIFGIIGLFVGVAAFICRFYSTSITKAAMLVQSLMGWYVFVVYVFAIPANGAANLQEGALGLSIGTTRFLITLGILTSFHFCLALQGGQFVFFARLVCAATGRDFLMQKSGYKMRAAFWNANFALAGLWTFITGCIINAEVGGGTISGRYAFPPNVGRLPGLTIFTGLLMLLWGLCGIGIGLSAIRAGSWYYLTTGIVYIFTFLNFTLVQFGKLEAPGAAGISMHSGLVFMVIFLGPYFVYRLQNQEPEDRMA